MEKECKECGNDIIGEPLHLNYCSDECYIKNRLEYGKRYKQSPKYLLYLQTPKRIEAQKINLIKLKKKLKTPAGRYRTYILGIKRKEKLFNTTSTWTARGWKEKLRKTNDICPCCNDKVDKLTMDHTPSLSQANKFYQFCGIKTNYNIRSLTPLCKRCNNLKRTKNLSLDQLKILVEKLK